MPSSNRFRIGALVAVLLLCGLAAAVVWDPSEPNVRPQLPLPAVNVVWEGDSQSAVLPDIGTTADYATDGLDDVAFTRTVATPGAVLDTLIARVEQVDGAFVAQDGTRNVLVVWAGTNDLGFGEDPTTVYQKLRDYVTARRQRGWEVVVATALPRTYPNDVPGYEDRRQAFNSLLRAYWREFADAFADPGLDPEVGYQGAQANPAYFTADILHLNDDGRRYVGELIGAALRDLDID